jgi:hypothetical protein
MKAGRTTKATEPPGWLHRAAHRPLLATELPVTLWVHRRGGRHLHRGYLATGKGGPTSSERANVATGCFLVVGAIGSAPGGV